MKTEAERLDASEAFVEWVRKDFFEHLENELGDLYGAQRRFLETQINDNIPASSDPAPAPLSIAERVAQIEGMDHIDPAHKKALLASLIAELS